MKHQKKLFLLPVAFTVALSSCSGAQWESLSDEDFTRHSEPLKAELHQYVEAQREFFTANERYGARHELTDEDATPPADVEDLRVGHSRVAYNDSIPQMICGVFVGTAEPPLSVEMEEGVPVCQREASVLVCEEGHAYPATVEYNFCPMHGHALVEVELEY